MTSEAQVSEENPTEVDAELDSDLDAAVDAAVDAEFDADVAAERDGEVDSRDGEVDADVDSNVDGELDAGTDADVDADSPAGTAAQELLVREGDIAADYIEQLLDIVDFDGDIDLDVENDRAMVAVVGDNLRGLIGGSGATLDALQELVRLAVQQQTGVRSRLMLDVGGHRQQRRTQLSELARTTAGQVRESGEAARLTPMNPFERKVVHDVIAGMDGVFSESEGEEPQRRVVVHPAG